MPITEPRARSIASPRIKVKRGDRCLDHQRTDRSSRGKRSPRHARSPVGGSLRTGMPGVRASQCFSTKNVSSQTRSSQRDLAFTGTPLGAGVNAGQKKASSLGRNRVRDGRGIFPPQLITTIKSIACEVPANLKQPVSRLFIPDIHRIVINERHVESISLSTIWRILDADSIKPWRYRSWIWCPGSPFRRTSGTSIGSVRGQMERPTSTFRRVRDFRGREDNAIGPHPDPQHRDGNRRARLASGT